MDDSRGYISEVPTKIKWHYDVPQDRASKMTLLTVGGLQVTGNWGPGGWGEQFIAWAPLLKREKAREEALWAAYYAGESLDAVNAKFNAPAQPPCILPEDHEGECTQDTADPRHVQAQQDCQSANTETESH